MSVSFIHKSGWHMARTKPSLPSSTQETRGPEGRAHRTAPDCASARGGRAVHIRLRKWQLRNRGIRSRLQNHSCGKRAVFSPAPLSISHPNPQLPTPQQAGVSSPAGVVNTPLIVLLWCHLRMAGGEKLLQQHPAAGLSPGCTVGIHLQAHTQGSAAAPGLPEVLPSPTFRNLPHLSPVFPPGLTVQGCGISPGSGHRGLRRQEWAASSAVGSSTPWRLRRSLLASPSKSPHNPDTRPRNWGDSCTRTRVPGSSKWTNDPPSPGQGWEDRRCAVTIPANRKHSVC